MKRITLVRVFGLSICFVLLAAVCVLTKIDRRVSASQSNPDCRNEGATRDRIKTSLSSMRISNLKVKVKDGKVRVEGKVNNSADVENVKIAFRNMQDRCISEDGVNTDGLVIRCPSDQEILKNVKYLLANLRCSVAKGLTVSINNRVVTIAGTVPDEKFKNFLVRMVESVDCVKAGVRNNLVVSAPKTFSGDCSRLSASELKKILEDEVGSRMPCGVLDYAHINVANGVVTLTGQASSAHRWKMLEIIRSICPGFFTEANLLDSLILVDPSCPQGARSCTTPDGEQYCCTGCSTCPTN